MKKLSGVFFVIITNFASLLVAQDLTKPLDDDFCAWMIGDWEGVTTSTLGKARFTEKNEWGLDKQFVISHDVVTNSEVSPEQLKATADALKTTVEDVKKMYESTPKSMTILTVDRKSGEYVSYGFDNTRFHARFTGKREGNKLIVNGVDAASGINFSQTIEKVTEDKMSVAFLAKDSNGKLVNQGQAELTRKKNSGKN